jgi:hypothetical protein
MIDLVVAVIVIEMTVCHSKSQIFEFTIIFIVIFQRVITCVEQLDQWRYVR